MQQDFSLRPYQSAHLAFHIKNDRSLNLSDPGTGKTPTICLLIQYRYQFNNSKTVFVMPISLLKKNKAELMRFTNFTEEDIALVRGTPKKRAEMYQDPNKKIFLMGFQTFAAEWKKLPADTQNIVVDEFHLGFKSNDSKRTQSFYEAMRKIKYCTFMTGTLINGRLDSAYPAVRVIDPRYYFNYGQFLLFHQIKDNITGAVLGWRNHERLAQILSNHAVKIRFADAYKDSPLPIITHEICEMNEKHFEIYKQMEESALLELEDKFIDASGSGGVHQLRCRQLISAPESVGVKREFDLGKLNSLEVHLEDAKNSNKPLIIFSVFKAEQDLIVKLCQECGFRTGLINGDISGPERSRIDEEFRAGNIDIIVGSPACMAVGFNWEHVDNVIFTSLTYLDSDFDQAIKRADRGTRKYPLRVTILEYDVAVEKRVWNIIQRKMRDSRKVGW